MVLVSLVQQALSSRITLRRNPPTLSTSRLEKMTGTAQSLNIFTSITCATTHADTKHAWTFTRGGMHGCYHGGSRDAANLLRETGEEASGIRRWYLMKSLTFIRKNPLRAAMSSSSGR